MKSNRNMILAVLVAAIVFMAAPQAVHAWGTWSGTQVDNTALVSFSAGSVAYTTSDTASFVVDELINIQVTNNVLGTNLTVWPGETDRPLAFDVQNAGNSTIDLHIGAFGDGTLFVSNVTIWSEDGTSAGFQTTEDTNLSAVAYTVVSANVDSIYTFYIVADVSSSPVTTNTPDVFDLLVAAFNSGAPIGTENSDPALAMTVQSVMADTGGTYSGDVNYDGQDSAQAVYNLLYADLSLTKSFVVNDSDPFNVGNHAIPGATVEYTLHVLNAGTGAATGISITDTTPAGTTFGAGTASATAGTVLQEDPVIWSISNLAGGSSADLTFEVVITPGP